MGSLWAGAGALSSFSFLLLLLFLAGGAKAAEGAPGSSSSSSSFFFHQLRGECHFAPAAAANGTEAGKEEPLPLPQVCLVVRYIYNRQEMIRFDSTLGRYEALSPVAQANVDRWNRDPAGLQRVMAAVEGFCRHNYGIFEPFALQRKIQPKLKITPMEYESSSDNMMLICFVDSFFPTKIKITWFRNGKEEEGPQVMTTDVFQNGDWTYGIQVMLETKPKRGDIYTCQVEHAGFPSPASVQWEPQSDSARSKMWTGIVGILLGVVFVATGLSFYLRNKKGQTMTQTTVGLMD